MKPLSQDAAAGTMYMKASLSSSKKLPTGANLKV